MPTPVDDVVRNLAATNPFLEKTEGLAEEFVSLLGFSLASSTWKKYKTALNLWKKFREQTGNENVKFFSRKLGIPFICWCGKYKKLSVKTVENYISAIKKISSLNGSRLKEVFDSDLAKTLLSGLENKRKPQIKEKEKTEPVTLGMLGKIKQKLRKAEWPELTKTSFWSACLLAFWGAFRLGEILTEKETFFDKFSNLLWKDLKIEEDHLTLKVKSPKNRKLAFDKVYLCALSEKDFCPVQAMLQLEKMCKLNFGSEMWEKPVFRLDGGENLTKSALMKNFKGLLLGTAYQNSKISGKSFRAGLVSGLQKFPKSFNEQHAKSLGRWRGNSYQLYLKNDKPVDEWLFKLVAERLIKNSFSMQVEASQGSASDQLSAAVSQRNRTKLSLRARNLSKKLRKLST